MENHADRVAVDRIGGAVCGQGGEREHQRGLD